MGALSRRKGAAYERFVTTVFRMIFGATVKRGIGQERAGSEIADVAGVPGLWVQTKHGKYISIRDAVVQGEAELAASGKAGHAVLAVTRFNGERDLATMRLTDFVMLLAELHYRRRVMAEDVLAPKILEDCVSRYMSAFKLEVSKYLSGFWPTEGAPRGE